MNLEELNPTEKALIEIIRAFSFLKWENYHEKEITIEGRGNPSIVFHNWISNLTVRIIGNESQSWSIVIQRKRIIAFRKESVCFDISDYFSSFDCALIKGRHYTLHAQSKFIQQYLMPIIKGEMWIDELIKQK